MQHNGNAIPAAGERREIGSILARMYRDIGLAAVADALGIAAAEVDADLKAPVERGASYLHSQPADGASDRAA